MNRGAMGALVRMATQAHQTVHGTGVSLDRLREITHLSLLEAAETVDTLVEQGVMTLGDDGLYRVGPP